MEDQIAKARKWIVRYGICGALFFIITIGIYFVNFHGPLESQQSQWGVFGDYLGGILNPILSFLAFLGLLWTISLNYDELRRTSEYLKKEEIQQQKQDIYRLIETIYSELKEVLDQKCVSGGYVDKPTYSSIKILLGDKNIDNKTLNDFVKNNNNDFLTLHDLFHQLKFYLQQYDNLTHDNFASAYYKRYFISIILNLYNLEVIPVELKEYFNDFTVYS